jgi:lipopolysaccharide biosynthesis glycosyltransferase
MIRIALSTDLAGMRWNATLIASVMRRASRPVEIRVYTRDFEEESFEVNGLRVDFISVDESADGRFPGHVPDAVFDRLRIIRDEPDWERALILDHDMVVLCDLAPYFDESFEGNQLMGRLFGESNTLGLQMKQRGGLPPEWSHCEDYPYFFMGPMLNLRQMRKEGTWDKLLAAHTAIGEDEQISLTAATEGRVKGVGKKWNLVPQWDRFEELQQSISPKSAGCGGIEWNQGCPIGVIHWTGPAKPWHHQTKVWRPDLWESERSSWEHLRLGIWKKPEACEVFPISLDGATALAKRGWKVKAIVEGTEGMDPIEGRFPDLKVEVMNTGEHIEIPLAEMLRLGPSITISDHLLDQLPDSFVLSGPRSAVDVRRIRELDDFFEARYVRNQWPAGGPDPRELDYWKPTSGRAIGFHEDVAFARHPERIIELPLAFEPPPRLADAPYLLCNFLESELASLFPISGPVVEIGYGRYTELLAAKFPQSSVTVLSEDTKTIEVLERLSAGGRIHPIHAPLETDLGWFDVAGVDLPVACLLVVDGPDFNPVSVSRGGAVSLVGGLSPDAGILLCGTDHENHRTLLPGWLDAGCRVILEGFDFLFLRRDKKLLRPVPDFATHAKLDLQALIDRAYIVYTDSERLAAGAATAREKQTLGVPCETVGAVRPYRGSIRWEQIRNFEAGGLTKNLSDDYVVRELARLQGMREALRRFSESTDDTGLIVENGIKWVEGARDLIELALSELPKKWDLVMLQASQIEQFNMIGRRLAELTDFTPGRAAIWRRDCAARLLPELDKCDCEFDVLLRKVARQWKVFGVVPFPANQCHDPK